MNPYTKYKSVAVNTGGKLQQLLMLFDEAIKFLYQSVKSKEKNDAEGEYKNLEKAENIFQALKTGINLSFDNELIKYLDKFYSSTIAEISRINRKSGSVEEIQKLIDTIRDVRDTIFDLAKSEDLA